MSFFLLNFFGLSSLDFLYKILFLIIRKKGFLRLDWFRYKITLFVLYPITCKFLR